MRHTAAFGLMLSSLIGVLFFVSHTPAPSSAGTIATTPPAAGVPITGAELHAPAPAARVYRPSPALGAAAAPVVSATSKPEAGAPAPQQTDLPTASASLRITASSTHVYTLPVRERATLADAMTEISRTTDLTFRSHESSGMGIFIDSITGLSNADGYYWILWVNGAKSGVGASSLVLHPGDAVEWRYEKGY